MKEISRSVLKTLIYQSIFGCSPRLSDFSKWIISSKPFSRKELNVAIKRMKKVSLKKNHIYLRDTPFVKASLKRTGYAQDKISIARRYANLLSKIPWYRMIAISGAVASYNATRNDDIDFFVIVAPQRIWFARLADWLVLNLLKARRNADSTALNNKICINYYLSEDSLELQNKDLYTANEIARLMPLYGEDVYHKFVLSNPWVKSYLANFWRDFTNEYGAEYDRQLPFRFILFDLLESLLGRVQIWYMKRKMTKEIVSEQEIRFHPKDVRKSVLAKYDKLIKEFEI